MVIHKIRKAHKRVVHGVSRLRKYSYQRSRRLAELQRTIEFWRQFEWKHRNLIWLLVSIIIAYVIVKSPAVNNMIKNVGTLGFVGAFFAGMFFTYGLTAAPATAALLILGRTLHYPFITALIAGAGAVMSDYVIFRLVRDKLIEEIRLTGEEILGRSIHIKINPNSLTAKAIPILAGLIIASPLPDEFGAALLGAAKIRTIKFVEYSFLFNFIGIFIITSLGASYT